MNVIFNGIVSGFGNNGGTRTVLKSAEVLRGLGCNVECLSNVDNFTWFDHRKTINYVPKNTDVVINIAAIDYNVTRRLDIPIKIAWWRAHEDWSNSDNDLRSYYLDLAVKNITNSCGLSNKLKNDFGAYSEVIYQGIDFDWWENRELRPKNKTRIGCLYTKQPRKRWIDFVKLSEILGTKEYEYVGIGNAVPRCDFLADFKLNANVEDLNNLYSSCHVWFAPTESEGLHNVPMEANLCGCLVVCSNHKLNGMIYDYAFDTGSLPTAMIYNVFDIEHAAKLIKASNHQLVSNMQFFIMEFIGSRETNMQKFMNVFKHNV